MHLHEILLQCITKRLGLSLHPAGYHSIYIMLIREDEHYAVSMLEALVKHTLSGGWELNPLKIRGPATSV